MEMEKEKGIDKAGFFNRADYDYMDNLGYAGWEFEFKKRNLSNNSYVEVRGLKISKDSDITITGDTQCYYVRSSSLTKLKHRTEPAIVQKSPSGGKIEIDGYELKAVEIVKPPKYKQKYKRLYSHGAFVSTDDTPESMIKEDTNPFTIMFLCDVSGNQELILDEFKRQLTTWQRELKRLLGMPSKRMRKEWKEYLMVYDLKEKYGKDFREIASIVYPQDENDYTSGFPATKKVRQNYKRALELIGGDYKRYIPPMKK
jgi:hypothetical protein